MTPSISELAGYTVIPEPKLVFAGGNLDPHPLRGIVANGPFSLSLGVPARVRIAQLAPQGHLPKIAGILGELRRPAIVREAKNYYPE
jgi:hypothetical protein